MVFMFLCLHVFLSDYFICLPILCMFQSFSYLYFYCYLHFVFNPFFNFSATFFSFFHHHNCIFVSLFSFFPFLVSSFFFWFARTNLFPFIRSCSVVEDAHSRVIVEKETFVKKCRKNVLIEKNNMNEFVKIMPLRWN